MRRLSALTHADVDPTRRHLLHASLYSLAGLTVPEPRPLPDRTYDRTAPHSCDAQSRATQGEVGQMQTMARVFAEAAQLHGPGHVRTALTAYLGHDVTGYLSAPATEHLHRRLLSGAAQLTVLLGTMCAGDGADALAQHYHRTAAQMAADADDMTTYAIALRTMSAHAHDLGHHSRSVLNLAERAAACDRTPPIVRAYAYAHLAVIQAHHDRRAALTALTAAERLHDRADTTPGPFSHYPAGALHYQRAQTLATLGDKPGALSALNLSLRLRTPAEHHACTLTRARTAETLLAQGQLDAALTHWQIFVDSYPTLHSVQATRHLDTMRRLLHPHRSHRPAAFLLTQSATLR
ncbi:hypothetical protein [Streptomyces sp. McG8]|uniref:hypothetical protein n=1 Tax=Streptomyces sp. McG8 TaxID=2725487 RepID=UPI002036B943